MWGFWSRALSHPRLPALWAGCRGPLPTGCGCGGVQAWGPVTNPTARALASWLCALWGRHEDARGGRLLPGSGASRVRRSPTPDCPPSGRAAGPHYRLAVGAGGCGRGDPSPTPQRTLLLAAGAASGCPGGAPLAWVWGVRGRALSHPRLPALWAGCRGPLPTSCGCAGVRSWGPVTNPIACALASWLCALWGRHEGARGGGLLPGCGASGVGRSPTPDCLPSGRAAGAHYPLAVGAGGCGRGDPSPTPERALLRAVGRHEGARGGPLLPGCGVSGVGHSPNPDCPPSWRAAGAHYPLAVGGGVRAWRPVTHPTARAPSSWLRALGGRLEGARRGHLLPGCGASGVGRSPTPDCPPSGRAAGAHYPLAVGAGAAGVGTRHQPHSARSCMLWGRHEGARGGRLLPGCGASGVGHSPTPNCPPSGRAAGAHYPLAVGGGAAGVGTRHPSHSARSFELAPRAGGAGRGRPKGAPPAWVRGVQGSGALPPLTNRPFGRAAGARFPLAVGAVCGRGGPAVLGTLSLAAVRGVLCAAPGGRCGLAPVLVPWLWPAACLSGVPRGLAFVRRSSSSPVALGAPVAFSVAVVISPTPGAVAPGFTGWLRGARGGRPRTGLIVPAAGPCRGKGAGRAPRRTRCGPRDGVVPGGFLRLRSWAACAAVVWRVWTWSVMRPVSRTVCLATGDSAGAPGPFRVDADTAPLGSEDATPGSRACVRVRALLGPFGRAGLSGAFWCASPFLWPFLVRSLLARPPPAWGCPVCGCCWVFFLFFFPFSPSLRPRCVLPCVFSGPGCLGPWRLVPPPLCFSSPPPPCCRWRFLLSGWLGPLRPPFPLFFLFFPWFLVLSFSIFFFFGLCSGVSCCVFPVLPVRCAVRFFCAVSGGWCCWFLVSLPFVGGLLVALVARRCRLVVCVASGARVWSGCRWASSLWCPVPLCCVLWRCAAVWGCAVVPCLLFLFFSLLVALVSCCSLWGLGSGPVPGRFCFCALPVRCCAGVPASLLSVRCSLALAGLAGVLCCCLLCLCVCCWAWLFSVVSWWVLVAPGVVSRWHAVACPWVLCCAVLLRVAPPGVALLCAVLFRFAPFGAAARCVVSRGAVRRLGVLCLLAPFFVLSPRAVCVLLWCVAAWCCSPLCFVPCSP